MAAHFLAHPNAPIAAKRTATSVHHGVTLTDDYGWLRAENWQEAMRNPAALPADIADYLRAENTYYDAAMADTAALQEALIKQMRGRIKEDDSTVPRNDGPYAYATRYTDGAEHPIFVRAPRDGGTEVILLDANIEAAGADYFSLGGFDVAPDHATLAWKVDTNGSEFYQLRFRDLASGQDSATVIADVGATAWADAQTLFYVKVDAQHRPNRVFLHRLGTDPAGDIDVYKEADDRYCVSVWRTRSGAFVMINTGMNDENEILMIPADAPMTPPAIVATRTPGLEYDLEHQGNDFIILTNADGAEDFKIVRAPVATPDRTHWADLVPHVQGRMIVSIAAYADWLIWVERADALPRICYLPRGADPATATQSIAFAEEAFALGADASPEYATDAFRFTYSSPTTPAQVFDFDLATGGRVLRKTQEIPSGHNPADYVTRRITATSHDGAEVPVTILYRADTPLDGSAPCLLYGYGSYGASLPASFATNRLSLVDRGFVYAIAHVRGGQEKGRAWYEAAKFGQKPNTFHDFIAAADALNKAQYTAAGQIVIQGGSAGGLLVGAVLNMRPDLWAGAIADVPFVDVLNTILDATLPLTPGEWSQWGNPIADKQAFDDIRSYSPYDHVSAQEYPPMLVTAGVSDPRVTYWEPAKWVAKLRATKTDANALLLRTNMTSGHFGKSGRFAALEDAARSYAFAIKATGGALAP